MYILINIIKNGDELNCRSAQPSPAKGFIPSFSSQLGTTIIIHSYVNIDEYNHIQI